MPIETVQLVELQSPRGQDRAKVFPCAAGLVIVLADGAGGRPGGAEAAEGAVNAIMQVIESGRFPADPFGWVAELRRIDGVLAEDHLSGETTVVVATVTSAGVYGASVGDSGAWLIGAERWTELTAGQVRKPFLGMGAAVPRPFAAPKSPATLLVASDGLLKYTSPERICQVVRDEAFQSAPRKLVELVQYRPGMLPDDVAIVLARWQ
jgi:serine/threonine protein phosphatase PrpC